MSHELTKKKNRSCQIKYHIWGSGFIAETLAEKFPHESVAIITDRNQQSFGDEYPKVETRSPLEILTQQHKNCVGIYCTGPSSILDAEMLPQTLVPWKIRFQQFRKVAGSYERVIYISSGGTVYEPILRPAKETDKTINSSKYASYHLKNEIELLSADEIKKKLTILRLANPFGVKQVRKNGIGFLSAAIRCAKTGEQLVIYGKGNVIRDYFYVNDLEKIILEVKKQKDFPKILNVGSGEGRSQIEIIELVENVTKTKLNIKQLPHRQIDRTFSVLDINLLLQQIPNFRPTKLKEAISEVWELINEKKIK